MKVFLANVFKLDDGYQEILIDENNFSSIRLLQVFPVTQSIDGLEYNDVFILEPNSSYEILLKENTPLDFSHFSPHFRLLRAGLIISDINKEIRSIFVYNPTQNHIFIRSNAVIGEIE